MGRGTARAKPDGTRAETTFRLLPKRTNPFKLTGELVQSTAGSRGVRISVSNAGYTNFRGRVRVLATHSIRQFPLHFLCRVPPHSERSIQFCSFVTTALGGPWSTTHPGRFSPSREPQNALNTRKGGFQSRYGRFEEKKIPWIVPLYIMTDVHILDYKITAFQFIFRHVPMLYRRSQRPRGRRCTSAAASLRRSWVRIPRGHRCLSVVSVVCC